MALVTGALTTWFIVVLLMIMIALLLFTVIKTTEASLAIHTKEYDRAYEATKNVAIASGLASGASVGLLILLLYTIIKGF